MKLTHTILAAAVASAMALSLSACNNSGQDQSSAANNPESAATAMNDASSMAPMAGQTSMAAPASPASMAAMPEAGSTSASSYGTATTNWFGGPIYNGEPDLKATAALVKAGGGADNFDFSKALVSMLGEKTVKAEVAKLTKQYGKENVDNFISGMTFAVTDGLKRATEQGVKLPDAPADLHGKKLAEGLVKAGTAPDGTFWSGYLFDMTLSHPLHVAVMADIDSKFSHAADENTQVGS